MNASTLKQKLKRNKIARIGAKVLLPNPYPKYYEKLATKCKKSYQSKFYNKRRKCLYDVLGDSKIRPNQLFALSLTYLYMNHFMEKE